VKEMAEKANRISQKKLKTLPKILGNPKQYGSVYIYSISSSSKNYFMGEDMTFWGIYSRHINFR
jgi:hypothetical protein